MRGFYAIRRANVNGRKWADPDADFWVVDSQPNLAKALGRHLSF
jgi:hypothetical protein